MKLSKKFTTVTPFSKALAMFLFLTFPFVGFFLGMQYQAILDQYQQETPYVPTPHPTPQYMDVEPTGPNSCGWQTICDNKVPSTCKVVQVCSPSPEHQNLQK